MFHIIKTKAISLTYLPLQISCFIRGGPGQYPWVTEAGSQERPHYKHKQDTSYDWDDWSQLQRQERTTDRTGRDVGRNRNEQTMNSPPVLPPMLS